MNLTFIRQVVIRDLAALELEVRAYDIEDDLWSCPPGIINSAGTLVLHVLGNLQHFIGAQLGGTGYVRDRSAEFADRNVSRVELEARIAETIAAVDKTLQGLDQRLLDQEYPLEVGGVRIATGLFLTHLAGHLAYHLGQIDYHRRMVTGQSEGVGAQSIAQLHDAGPT